MLIVRAPLRISIGGGGTDIPSYYENNGGTVFSSLAIDKYIYVLLNDRFSKEIFLRYSENELIDDHRHIKHPIIRETIKNLNHNTESIEITSVSDVPGGTGLGSSGTFGVALQLALRHKFKMECSQEIVARESTNIEMNILKRPIGLQDQYISAYGGLTEFKVDAESNVKVKKYPLNEEIKKKIKENLLLFYVDSTRDSSKVLSEEKKLMESNHKGKYDDIVNLGKTMFKKLTSLDLENYGKIMHEYWLIKRSRQKNFTEVRLNRIYDYLIEKDLIFGGKIVGAGGGGFFLFVSDNPETLRNEIKQFGMKELKFQASEAGASLVEF